MYSEFFRKTEIYELMILKVFMNDILIRDLSDIS